MKTFISRSEAGPYLNINEDVVEYDLQNKIYMVVDGFGGTGLGDVTSRNAAKKIKNFYLKLHHDEDATLPFFYSPGNSLEMNLLINAVLNTHHSIYKDNEPRGLMERSGASGIFMCQENDLLHLVSVGNCYAYRFREGEISRLFIPDDHQFSTNNVANIGNRQFPTSGLGLFEDLYYQKREVRVEQGDVIILGSKGALALLAEEQLAEVFCRQRENFQQKSQLLFDLSNERGNKNNQSLLILEY